MITKSIAAAEVKAVSTDDPNGAFEVILSAPTLDRDGEVIDSNAFDPLPEHITFDIDHGLSTATTVGSGVPRYDGGLLKVAGTFSSIPRAQEVRTLVDEGHIRTTSVAFMNPKREIKDGVPHVVKAELLNGAFVPVPANREAVVLAAKTFRERALPSAKAIEGSYEERRETLAHAIRVAHDDAWWSYVVATFDDSVVYELEGDDGTTRWQAPYSIDNDGEVTLGTAEPVDIVEVVQPAEKAADDAKIPDATPEPDAAAPAAASAPAVSARAVAAAFLAPADLLTNPGQHSNPPAGRARGSANPPKEGT